jgi:hypothetical protein
VKSDCSTVVAPVSVSTIAGSIDGARRAHVASNNGNVLYAWIVDSVDVHVRAANNIGGFASAADSPLILHSATQQIDHVRVAPLAMGFAVVVRWSSTDGMGPGKIELYRVTSAGATIGGPTLITDKSASDFTSDKSFGVATRDDGALLVVWHQCDTGAGSCDVLGRLVRPTGVPVGDPFGLATTTMNDQTDPSVLALSDSFVAGWTDLSDTDPDKSGAAVRARILYPAYDSATAVLGAECGGTKPDCGTGLTCATGNSDEMLRCYQTCNPAAPPSCPAGGTCTAVSGGGSACVF